MTKNKAHDHGVDHGLLPDKSRTVIILVYRSLQ